MRSRLKRKEEKISPPSGSELQSPGTKASVKQMSYAYPQFYSIIYPSLLNSFGWISLLMPRGKDINLRWPYFIENVFGLKLSNEELKLFWIITWSKPWSKNLNLNLFKFNLFKCKIVVMWSFSKHWTVRLCFDSVLSRCVGRTSDTSLDKDWGIRPGSRSRQSRDLPVDGKKLVIRQHIKNNNMSGKKRDCQLCWNQSVQFCGWYVQSLFMSRKVPDFDEDY